MTATNRDGEYRGDKPLIKKLSEATRNLTEAYEAEAEAQVKCLYDKEELRAAEGNSTLERIRKGTLGKNEVERRAQLDADCSFERNKMIESEAEVIRQTARRKSWETRMKAIELFLAEPEVWSTKGA